MRTRRSTEVFLEEGELPVDVRLQFGLGKGWGSFWKAEVLSGEVTKLPPLLSRPGWVLAAEAGREHGPEFRLVYAVKFAHRVGAY